MKQFLQIMFFAMLVGVSGRMCGVAAPDLYQDLQQAIKEGNVARVQTIIGNPGFDLNRPIIWDFQPLGYAIYAADFSPNSEIVNVLLSSGATIRQNIPNYTGDLCIAILTLKRNLKRPALKEESIKIIRLLINAGARCNEPIRDPEVAEIVENLRKAPWQKKVVVSAQSKEEDIKQSAASASSMSKPAGKKEGK